MARSERPEAEHDPSRRAFFRTFGRETVRQAGAVAGAAAELRRASTEAARTLLGSDQPSGRTATPVAEPPTETTRRSSADWNFRSPYRFTGSALVVQDLRELPGRVETLTLTAPSEVAAAIRVGAIGAGPVLAQVGAYAMVAAFVAAAERPAVGRHQQMRAAAGTLRGARREVRALGHGVDRIEARYDELADGDTDPTDLAAALKAEADLLTTEATAAHLAIGRLGADMLAATGAETLNLLVHGDTGPLACGMVGMLTAVLDELAAAGRGVHVWLTEAAPTGDGGRIAASQLRQLDVAHTVVPDSAVAWLLERQTIDALLLRGDRIAANGDTGVLVGGLGAARLAAAASVPVHVIAPRISIDPAAATGDQIRADSAFATAAARLDPSQDVVPAELIGAFVTDAGLLEAPYHVALSKALG
jgi:methylthioribose-1-phosphate isomerase